MARSTPTPVAPSFTGAVVAMGAAPVDGDILPVGPDVALLVTNGGGSPVTVTIQTTAKKSGLSVANGGGPVAAGATRVFGPFPSSLFAQPDDATVGPNKVLVDYSGVTSVTRAVITL